MIPPPIPANEAERLAALRALGILDTVREERFDRVTRLAARLFHVPCVAISLIDQHRQWFKSAIGIEASETGRDVAFCAHTILQNTPLIVRDATKDPRFEGHPSVTKDGGIRFYAGRQLRSRSGHCVGSLCLVDYRPREFSASELEILHDIADLAQTEINELGVDDALELLMEADRQRTEQKQMFDALMEHSPCVVVIKDQEGRLVYANHRLEQLFGRPLSGLIGKHEGEFEWLPSETAKQIREDDKRILETGCPEQLLEVIPAADGTKRHLLAVKFPLRTTNRLLVAGMALDITREKEAEAALRTSEEQYRDLFENAGDMIWCIDAQGRYRYVNPAWHDVHGYTPEEVSKINMLDVVAPEDREHAANILKRVLSGQDLLGVQVHILTEDGRKLFIEGNVSHSVEDGQPVARGMFRDITARRTADEAMQRLTALQRAILNSANSAIISTDKDGVILTFNSTAERWLGYAADEVIGKKSSVSIYAPDEIAARAAELSEELGRLIEPGFEAFVAKARGVQGEEREWTCVRKDGTRFPVRLSVTALRDSNGEIFGFLGVSRDITHDRQVQEAMLQAKEAAEQANQTKSRFLANMSHEIRTPLNGILGINSMLLETTLNSEQRHLAETVRESGESLLGIINDILDFSKVEAGLIEVDESDFDLQQLLSELHRLHAIRASSRGLLLEVKAASDIPQYISGDPVRVRQVLSNFISNAIKFSEHGKIQVSATRQASEADGTMLLRFEVADRGIGIAPDACARVFEPFQQADSSTTRRYGGTGLGLSISKQLVQLMGGKIGVESALGEGSTFWFTVPVRSSVMPAQPGHTTPVASNEASLELGLRVLVAEDSSVNQLVILHELRKLGCHAQAAENGREALEMYTREAFDLVLMDCQMPEMDGYEATTRIRQIENFGKRIPIIAITANALAGERERCIDAGMTDYVTKPFTREKLRAAVIAAAHQVVMPTEEPAIDDSELAALRSEGEEAGFDLLAQMTEAFQAESTQAIDALEKAAVESDVDALSRAAHKLKGSAGNFGAKPLQALCFELETLAHEQKLHTASIRIPAVRHEVGRVITALSIK